MPGGGSEAVILPALMGSAEAAAVPAFLSAAVDSAAIGGIGAMLMGQNPLKGALLGGLTGGIGKAVLPQGLGSLFGGGVDMGKDAAVNMLDSQLADGAAGAAGSAAGAAANAGGSSFLSKMAGPAALGLGAMAIDRASAPKQLGPTPRDPLQSKPVSPLDRDYMDVDPASYLTSGGNRSFYHPYSMQPTYYSKGGNVKNFDNGGSASTGHSTLPIGPNLVKGKGDGMSDNIPAMLSDGEYVFSSSAVSALGNGSNDAGAKKLDKMHKKILSTHYKSKKPKKAVGLGRYMN